MKTHTQLSLLFSALLFTATVKAQTTTSTPQQMVDALHGVFGKNPNARAVHAKGIITEGTFTPSAEAKKISKALQFRGGGTPITVRF